MSKFSGMFDNIITKGYVTTTRDIFDMQVVMRALSAGERNKTDALISKETNAIPYDTAQIIRSRYAIAHAIISIDGVDVSEGLASVNAKTDRDDLYEMLGTLPSIVYSKFVDQYNETVSEQDDMFKQAEEEIENF